MPEHFPPVEGQTEWRVIRLPERRNYIHHDALLCCSTNTWQAASAADLSTGKRKKNTRGDGSYSLTFYFFISGGKVRKIPLCVWLIYALGLEHRLCNPNATPPHACTEVASAPVMRIYEAPHERGCGGLPRAEPLWV